MFNVLDWRLQFLPLNFLLLTIFGLYIMKNRKIGQKISLVFSITCYLMSLVTVAFGAYWWTNYGTSNPIFASAIASVIFFISCGVVLQVIANTNLPDLKIKSESI